MNIMDILRFTADPYHRLLTAGTCIYVCWVSDGHAAR